MFLSSTEKPQIPPSPPPGTRPNSKVLVNLHMPTPPDNPVKKPFCILFGFWGPFNRTVKQTKKQTYIFLYINRFRFRNNYIATTMKNNKINLITIIKTLKMYFNIAILNEFI